MDTSSTPSPVSLESVSHGRYRAGDVLADRYRLSHPTAVGGMGAVWASKNLALDLPVALKLLHPGAANAGLDSDYLSESLWREARAAASLNHPAIVKAYDFGMTKWNDAYMAMELLAGEPLSALFAREYRLSAERAVQIMLPIADGPGLRPRARHRAS